MWNHITAQDASAQNLSAWIGDEELRTLLSTVRTGGDPHLTRHRLHRFLCWCTDSQIPEPLTLARTVGAWWWPQIRAFIATGITNAGTEGYIRLVTQTKRVGCGFRNGRTRPAASVCTARGTHSRNPDQRVFTWGSRARFMGRTGQQQTDIPLNIPLNSLRQRAFHQIG